MENNQVVVSRAGEDAEAKALHGLSRAIINNLVKGVSDGFSKKRKDLEVGREGEEGCGAGGEVAREVLLDGRAGGWVAAEEFS